MALPSTCRPLEVEEEHREYEEQKKKESLKVKLPSENKAFMNTMVDWYHVKLTKQKRSKLKKKDVISKAINVCNCIGLDYTALPSNWLRQLHDEHKVDFIFIPPAQRAKIRAKRKLRKAYVLGQIKRGEMERLIEGVMNGSIPPELIFPDSIPDSVLAESVSVSGSGQSRQGQGQGQESKGSSSSSSHRIIDLTDEPPPESWMTAYVDGKYLPRVLKVHKDEKSSKLIVYYDYDAKLEREDGTAIGASMVHEGNNFLSYPTN